MSLFTDSKKTDANLKKCIIKQTSNELEFYDKSNEFGLNVHIKENSKIEENSDAFFS